MVFWDNSSLGSIKICWVAIMEFIQRIGRSSHRIIVIRLKFIGLIGIYICQIILKNWILMIAYTILFLIERRINIWLLSLNCSILFLQKSIMKFNQINRNSLMSGLYSERPSYNLPLKVDEQHLNPSKSKVNIRQSLNKTTENYTTNNPTINNIRNSCVLNTSLTTNSHIIQ